MESQYYSFDYWFNNPEHDNWDQGGANYYVNTFYDNLIMKLNDMPKNGKILMAKLNFRTADRTFFYWFFNFIQ